MEYGLFICEGLRPPLIILVRSDCDELKVLDLDFYLQHFLKWKCVCLHSAHSWISIGGQTTDGRKNHREIKTRYLNSSNGVLPIHFFHCIKQSKLKFLLHIIASIQTEIPVFLPDLFFILYCKSFSGYVMEFLVFLFLYVFVFLTRGQCGFFELQLVVLTNTYFILIAQRNENIWAIVG